ncbi:unnamed protein product [Rotaria sordida]|uniref:Uncharacterized protein n=1 Tax=Rotaria sordida TaxID=392033 RepID=A0A814LC30_9BILA|nr:unnamed protein product [Rotaria sordida]CAF1260157.1 unnamed protein product [Rotaria sordida]
MSLACFRIIQWLLLRKGYLTESILVKNVNQKSLDAFLLANILTRIINLNINTIDTLDFISLFIILIYISIVTAFIYFCLSLIKLIMKYLKLSKY